MKIDTLSLEHYRSFNRKVTFRLPDSGLVYLTGRNEVQPELEGNGVGKSSLFEGIYWTLFGKTSQNLKAGSVANWKHPRGCRGVIRGSHTIERTWSPNTLKLNGKEVDQQSLERELGISPDTFLHSWYLPQFSSSFLDLKPEQKMSLLVELLKLEVWDKASELAGETAFQAESETQVVQGRLEEINAAMEELDLESITLREREWAEKKRKTLRELGVQVHRAGNKGKNLQYFQQRLARAKRDADSLRYTVADAKATLHQLEEREEALSKAGAKCPVCGARLYKNHRLSELRQIRSHRIRAERSLREENQRAEREERIYDRLKQQLTSLEEDVEIRDRITELHSEVNPYTEQRREILGKRNKHRLRMIGLHKERDRLRKTAHDAGFWTKGFKEVRLLIVNSVIAQLEAEVNQTIHELGLEGWQVRFDVERENKSGSISRGFTTMVLSPDNEEPVPWESWSGGERQRLKLAGTMGFANLINGITGQNPNIEMWDEPSTWMSQRGIEQMLTALAERARKYRRCIMVADHRALGFPFDRRIAVVKDRHGSRIEGQLRIGGRK